MVIPYRIQRESAGRTHTHHTALRRSNEKNASEKLNHSFSHDTHTSAQETQRKAHAKSERVNRVDASTLKLGSNFEFWVSDCLRLTFNFGQKHIC